MQCNACRGRGHKSTCAHKKLWRFAEDEEENENLLHIMDQNKTVTGLNATMNIVYYLWPMNWLRNRLEKLLCR